MARHFAEYKQSMRAEMRRHFTGYEQSLKAVRVALLASSAAPAPSFRLAALACVLSLCSAALAVCS